MLKYFAISNPEDEVHAMRFEFVCLTLGLILAALRRSEPGGDAEVPDAEVPIAVPSSPRAYRSRSDLSASVDSTYDGSLVCLMNVSPSHTPSQE
jgi:hypothetical protein